MMEEKVYSQEVVPQNPFPGESQLVSSSSPANPAGTYTPTTEKTKSFPVKRTAVELLSTALNTRSRKILQEFKLEQSGGIQVGNFEEGLSGDLRITPNGITARDLSGITTFSIDGTSGDAIFKGEVQAGSFVSGQVIVGNGNVLIDGENSRIDIFSGETEVVRLDTTGLNVYGDNGDVFKIFDQVGGIKWGQLGYSVSAGFQHNIALSGRGGVGIYSYDGTGFSTEEARLLLGYNGPLYQDVSLRSSNGDVNISAGGDVNVTSPFRINGSLKTAVVPTTKGYKALYTAESPDVWFFDFCYAKKKRKWPFFWKYEWEIKADSLFLETVEPPFNIIPTGTKNLVQLWGKRKGFSKNRFEDKTKKEFEKNNEFWNH